MGKEGIMGEWVLWERVLIGKRVLWERVLMGEEGVGVGEWGGNIMLVYDSLALGVSMVLPSWGRRSLK